MINFEGEWYWGIDRLDYLEQRLMGLGLTHDKDYRDIKIFFLTFCLDHGFEQY